MKAEQRSFGRWLLARPSLALLVVNVPLLVAIVALSAWHDNSPMTMLLYGGLLATVQFGFLLGTTGRVAAVSILGLVLLQPLSVPLTQPTYLTLLPNLDISFEMDTKLFSGITGVSHVRTDENGFRTAGDYRNASTYKIFAVGASTTEQLYLDDNETTFGILHRALGTRFAVVNTGLAGIRAVHHAATIQEIRKYDPDLILVLLGINDWNCGLVHACRRAAILNPDAWSLTRVARRAVRRVYGLLSGPPVPVQSPSGETGQSPEGATTVTTWPAGGPEPFDRYHSAVMGRYDMKEKRPLDQWDDPLVYYRPDLLRVIRACMKTGAFCLFLTQPVSYSPQNFRDRGYRDSLWMTPPNQDWALSPEDLQRISALFNSYLKDAVTCDNCAVVDLDALMEHRREYFYDDVHFTESGARKFAEIIEDYLRRTGLLRR